MPGDSRWWKLLPPSVRQLPADLAAVVALLVLTLLSIGVPVVRDSPIRIVFGLAFVLFVPGYAMVAALFPEAGERPADDSEGSATEGIDGIERVAISFGLSIAVVPLVGLALNFTPWGIRLGPILVSVGGITLGCVAVAAARRRRLPPEERFSVPYREWGGAAREELFHPESRTDAALNVLLAVSVVLAAASVGYAVTDPNDGERFSEFYLLTESEDGELVADDYPTEFTAGESRSLVVGIGNQEGRPANYTVVVELQDVRIRNNSTTVLSESELRRFDTRVGHNETWHLQHTVTPRTTGEELRLTYLLYRGQAPADPTVENAYRELHLWVNVTAPA